MNHLGETELLDIYYGEAEAAMRQHLENCGECHARFGRLKATLEVLRDYPVPPRDSSYGGEVWNRLLPGLNPTKPRRWFTLRPLIVAPALAALLIAAFFTGMWTQQRRAGFPASARQRVLLLAISDHLERSQIILAELLHATPGSLDVARERGRARGLLDENRLLRQAASRAGDISQAALLEELERVLLDIANGPAERSPQDLEALQQRVENDSLLMKVRITSANTRQKGQRL